MGFLIHVNMQLYSYAFTSEGLSNVTKNLLAIAIVISSIDLALLDEATISTMVQYCYGNASKEVQEKIFRRFIDSKENKLKDEQRK